MVDFETVRFMKMLDELAAKVANGIIPFSKATQEWWNSRQYLFYDDKSEGYSIICDACIDELHHDIISYYSCEDYTVQLIFVEDEKPFVEVRSADTKYVIAVEDGIWYFA